MENLSHVSIVLVNPEIPENIGSVARAMKNMGLKELRLINPVPYKRIETYALAKKSRDIVDKALVYDDLQEALNPFSFVVGTTQRVRGRHYPLYTPQEAVDEMKGIGKKKIALVFGRESRGLTNEELRSCHIQSTIPTAIRQPAVNLAQSVMIYCYEMYRQMLDEEQAEVFTWDLAENNEIYHMYQHMESCLDAIAFQPRVDTKDFIDRFRRILGRVKLERRDLNLFHKLFSEVEWALKQLPYKGGEK